MLHKFELVGLSFGAASAGAMGVVTLAQVVASETFRFGETGGDLILYLSALGGSLAAALTTIYPLFDTKRHDFSPVGLIAKGAVELFLGFIWAFFFGLWLTGVIRQFVAPGWMPEMFAPPLEWAFNLAGSAPTPAHLFFWGFVGAKILLALQKVKIGNVGKWLINLLPKRGG